MFEHSQSNKILLKIRINSEVKLLNILEDIEWAVEGVSRFAFYPDNISSDPADVQIIYLVQ